MSPSFNFPYPSTVPLPAAGASGGRDAWESAAAGSTGAPQR
jgi:hypothetical protein